ncbi:MAG: hypothetical protein PHR44_01760 [Candidatus Omnitrophica bacterium]|nr:hypothetical protein [Candidatus Omnitrophota bacterium]
MIVVNDKYNLRIFWKLTSECRFMCPYCPDAHKRQTSREVTTRLSCDEWMVYWREFHARYGRCEIIINEEPLSYPGIGNIVSALQEIYYPIHIATALSCEVDFMIGQLDPAKIIINSQFHPLFIKTDDFLKRLFLLKKSDFTVHANMVAYPAYVDNVPLYIEDFRRAPLDIPLKINPYIGDYRGDRYPDAYSDEFKRMLNISDAPEADAGGAQPATGGSAQDCRWGVKDIYISETGRIWRCPLLGPQELIGNFFDIDFTPARQPCSRAVCCAEKKTEY